MNSPDDRLKRLLMGDKMAFEELVLETQNMVFGIVYSHTKDASVTEDLAQETYLKAFVSMNGLKEPAKIKSWIASIAHHTAINWVNKKREKLLDVLPDNAVYKDNEVEQKEQSKTLRLTLDELKPDEQEILIMRYQENLSYKDIANALDMTVSAVGEKLHRIHRNLEEKLKEKKEEML